MDLSVMVVADYANLAEGGKLNVMGIFSVIYSRNFPTRHPEMNVVLKFTAGPGEYGRRCTVTLKLLDEDARHEFVSLPIDLEVPRDPHGRIAEVNLIMKLRDIVFPKAGDYQFSILVNEDEKGTLPLYLIQSEAEQPES